MPTILVHEETLDPGFVPPTLPGREHEYRVLEERFRTRLTRGVPYHTLITGGVGSGKTALARRLSEDLHQRVKIRGLSVHPLYVNAWRRASDRTILLDLLRGVGVSLPDRGYGLSEMLDVFEQGIRRDPRHLVVVLDEVGALVRQGTKLVYLLSRAREIGLGSISLILIAPDDILPFLDTASRSSFGVTHRLHLAPYDEGQLEVILSARAKLALRPGSYSPEVVAQVARTAGTTGDARFALEVLSSAAQAAEAGGQDEITPEDVRAAKGSIAPTLDEQKLTGLSGTALLVLLGLARSLKGPHSTATTEKVRQSYAVVAEEHGAKPMSRVTFWRTVKELERDGLVEVEAASAGQSARLGMNELPASTLELLVEERVQPGRSRKR